MHRTRPRSQPKIPFYEKVNRFVFGPPKPEREPAGGGAQGPRRAPRGNKGRVAPADVMRVTGLPRDEAERLLLRLVVDYQGDIEVADSGAIVYKFADLRQTARARGPAAARRRPPGTSCAPCCR